MEFFQEQVRILEEKGVESDVLYSGTRSTDYHTEKDGIGAKIMNTLYGHNAAYYGIRAGVFYPKILKQSIFEEYDIVHVNSGMVAPLAMMQPQRPLVTTLWGDDLLSDRLNGYQSEITKQCAKRSDATIVRSKEMREELPCDAQIIPSGVDMEKFTPIEQEEALHQVGWSSEKKHILFPYSPSQSKKRYPAAKKIVEKVNYEIEEKVDMKTISGVPHEEMNLYYSAADVLLLPSLREGSPNTVKEAMACNLPVVSTNVGDVQERVGPVRNSFACKGDEEMKERVQQVVVSGERSNGRKFVEEVSLDTMGDRILSIYEALS
ncbi:glycosyltransferase family 4 protein [Natronococcus occultus]|uniref:Glycosyltransferase n=1 Tax=Natronococcus occultus SP4 TaxID=694430 RepID=L0K0E2_9EURY|nr:glycosyltransferase family 4 protein [Natronococcus occultus]AGB38767.1 glycosyltransferase [Natronococcus occultus SP4]